MDAETSVGLARIRRRVLRIARLPSDLHREVAARYLVWGHTAPDRQEVP
jgi:hypothetical protein